MDNYDNHARWCCRKTLPVSPYPVTPDARVMHISHSLTGVDAKAFVISGHDFHHAGDLMDGPTTPYVIHLGGSVC